MKWLAALSWPPPDSFCGGQRSASRVPPGSLPGQPPPGPLGGLRHRLVGNTWTSVVLSGVGGVGHSHPSRVPPPLHRPLPRHSSLVDLEGTLPCFSKRSPWSCPHLASGGEKPGGPSASHPLHLPKDSGSFSTAPSFLASLCAPSSFPRTLLFFIIMLS